MKERRWQSVSPLGRVQDGEDVGIQPSKGPGWAEERKCSSLQEITAITAS